MFSPVEPAPVLRPGEAAIAFRRSRDRTVLATLLAASPIRLLWPRNHGNAAWVYVSSLGGGLVDGDRLHARIDVGEGASALVATQASTKVYRSPRGCSQHIEARVAAGASFAFVPDPVACFAGAHYAQETAVTLEADASLFLLDGYTCGRSARGERWAFGRYASRTVIHRNGQRIVVDSTRLDPADGPIAERMGRFDVVLSLIALGPRYAPVLDAMRSAPDSAFAALATTRSTHHQGAILAFSPIAAGGAVIRVAAERYQGASQRLRACFAALAGVLGDDPFGRKW